MSDDLRTIRQREIDSKVQATLANALIAPSDLVDVLFEHAAIAISKMAHGNDSPWEQRQDTATRYVQSLKDAYYRAHSQKRESA